MNALACGDEVCSNIAPSRPIAPREYQQHCPGPPRPGRSRRLRRPLRRGCICYRWSHVTSAGLHWRASCDRPLGPAEPGGASPGAVLQRSRGAPGRSLHNASGQQRSVDSHRVMWSHLTGYWIPLSGHRSLGTALRS